MESITSGEMAGDDWLRSTFSRPLLSRDWWTGGPLRENVRTYFKTNQQNWLEIWKL
jgi:hypothetical protein